MLIPTVFLILVLIVRNKRKVYIQHSMVKGITNKHILICESIKRIFAKIISTQKKYQITLNCKIEYHLVLIDIDMQTHESERFLITFRDY